MANVQTKEIFQDLGKFKSVDCEKIVGVRICTIKFTKGDLTLSEKELKEVLSRLP